MPSGKASSSLFCEMNEARDDWQCVQGLDRQVLRASDLVDAEVVTERSAPGYDNEKLLGILLSLT